MNDRLAELQGDVPSWAQEEDANSNGDGGDIEMGQTKKDDDPWGKTPDDGNTATNNVNNEVPSQPEHMKQFFDDVEAIKLDISAVADATEKITAMKDKAVLATSEVEESNISDTIRTLVEGTNGRAKKCKNLLGLLKEENSNLKKEEKAKPTDLRVRDNLVNTLLRKFIDEMKRYQNAQQQYKTDVKKKVTRQVQMIKPDATDAEVDQIMRSEGVNDQIKTQYRAVAGKYQDILTLEASVAELHQMFLDFALLTEQQGELLDQIEYQVRSAADYVEDANVDVYEAIEYQKKIRKKQCWIVLIVVVVGIIVLFATGILG